MAVKRNNCLDKQMEKYQEATLEETRVSIAKINRLKFSK